MTEETFTPNEQPPEVQNREGNAQSESHPQASRYATAGRLGAERVHLLMERGKLFEKEHGLSAGRQRLRQLIQLGKRYEQEHGLAGPSRSPRQSKEDVWRDFLRLLSLVVKPAFQPQAQKLAKELTLFDGTTAA